MGLLDKLGQWRSDRESRRMDAARAHSKMMASADRLPLEAGHGEMRDAVTDLIGSRYPRPQAPLMQLTADPVVQALGRWNLELRYPLRGLTDSGFTNAFLSHIQWSAEQMNESHDLGPSSEDGITDNTWEAAKVVYLHDRMPPEWRKDFLDVVVGVACRLDWTARESGMESAARMVRPRRGP
jgi:hypothetical protein